jgi:cytochrome b6-f complex iron-sulfur subunit
MERRAFFKQLVIRGSSVVIVPALFIQACEKDDSPDDNPNNPGNGDNPFTLDLTDTDYAALQPIGGSVFITSRNIVVIHTGTDAYTVLSSVCTHQGCQVGFNNSNNTLPCPCHGSVYSITGSVINGPAVNPLTRYNSTLDGTDLVIDL